MAILTTHMVETSRTSEPDWEVRVVAPGPLLSEFFIEYGPITTYPRMSQRCPLEQAFPARGPWQDYWKFHAPLALPEDSCLGPLIPRTLFVRHGERGGRYRLRSR